MTTILNLYGGPGTGKSTSAAFLFYVLKSLGADVELVREYVKDWAWEKRTIGTYDQLYFLGKQVRRESMLLGKVDWVVTDSPVLIGTYYAQQHSPLSLAEGVRASTLAYYRQCDDDGHSHVHIFLRRSKPYVAEGRYHTEEEAKEADRGLRALLTTVRLPFIDCGTDEGDLRTLLLLLMDTELAPGSS